MSEKIPTSSNQDRFAVLSEDYADLSHEMWAEQGLDYHAAQQLIFDQVVAAVPNFKTKHILDIGIGDGETIARFVNVGCSHLTGIDINPDMLAASHKRFGDKVELLQVDARDLSRFKPGEISIVVTAMTIHNIPTRERKKVWDELVAMSPEVIVMLDKVADPDPSVHKQKYDSELRAIDIVYRNKHGRADLAAAWKKHYEEDEEERLELEELQKCLGGEYALSVVGDMGVNKAIVCRKK